jgi:MFS transporter, FSR family, fosmidomycin resistance protein
MFNHSSYRLLLPDFNSLKKLSGRSDRALSRLAAISLGHLMIDFYANIMAAIIPFLALTLNISLASLGLLLTMMLTSVSMAQPFFGIAVDRKGNGFLLPVAMLVTAVFMSSIGLFPTYWVIAVLAISGGMAASFYHPLGSSLTNELAKRKGAAMSVYVIGGSVGYALSPLIVVPLVQKFGLQNLIWLVLPGVTVALLLMYLGIHRIKFGLPQNDLKFKWPKGKTAKWLGVLNIIVACRAWTLAVVMGFFPLLYVLRGNTLISGGVLLTVFLAMGSIGIFIAGFLSDLISRKLLLVGTSVIGIVFYLLFFYSSGIWLWISLGVVGAAVQATIPVTIVMAQELIPQNKGLASGLVMGFAVGLGQIGALITGLLGDQIGLEPAVKTTLIIMLIGLGFSLYYPYKYRSESDSAVISL